MWSKSSAQSKFPVFCSFVLRVVIVAVAEIPVENPPSFWPEESGRRMSSE